MLNYYKLNNSWASNISKINFKSLHKTKPSLLVIFNDFSLNIFLYLTQIIDISHIIVDIAKPQNSMELYGTSMAVCLIMRAGLFAKSVFKRWGLFSRGSYSGVGT